MFARRPSDGTLFLRFHFHFHFHFLLLLLVLVLVLVLLFLPLVLVLFFVFSFGGFCRFLRCLLVSSSRFVLLAPLAGGRRL